MIQWTSLPVRRIHSAVAQLCFSIQSHDCYIAGGYARWACAPREDSPLPKDIDIICPSQRRFDSLKASLCHHGGISVLRDSPFSTTFKKRGLGYEVQLLKKFRGKTAQECLEKVDLSVCRVALLSHDSAVADCRFSEDERCGKMQVCHLDNEALLNTFMRMLRYARKGYDISQGEVKKVVEALRKSKTDPASTIPIVPSNSCFEFSS